MATNRPYLSLVQNSVIDDNITFEEIAHNYLYLARQGDKTFLMHDVEVGLNNSASAKTAMSKSGTYELLSYYQIPAVEHIFLLNENSRFAHNNPFAEAEKLFFQWGRSVVLKQDNGSQGSNVYKITTVDELEARLHELFSLQVNGAISPYRESNHEYRIVTLNHQPKLFLAKERTTSWKHNLINGAISKDVPEEKIPILSELAIRASMALDLEFCTIDILETTNGLHVLEINEQVMLDEYCKGNKERQAKVAALYREAILQRLAKEDKFK
ncbi:MAG: RimK family alpha-L-glutamate ligase [Anaerobacillus sp.]|uniref:ATP-grasp domain-containing protein n=1 Tax=Anaerobacillus sp. TaxID=1872506 RepID=UPI003918C1F7